MAQNVIRRFPDEAVMRWWRSPSKCLLLPAAMLLGLNPALARAQLVVQESGFTVTTIAQDIVSFGIECSPGGVWGDYVYASDIGVDNAGTIKRIDFSGNGALYASSRNGGFFKITANEAEVSAVSASGQLALFVSFLIAARFAAMRIRTLAGGR